MKTLVTLNALLLVLVFFQGCSGIIASRKTVSSITCSFAQGYEIAGVVFQPVYTNSSDAGYLKEYLPVGQTSNNWTKLFAVRCFKDLASPKDYIAGLGEEYRNKYPGMEFASGDQQSKGRYFIDFLAYPLVNASKYLEWDFIRAQTNTAGGIVVFQYAERRYSKKSIYHWDIKALRRQMLSLLMTNEFAIQ